MGHPLTRRARAAAVLTAAAVVSALSILCAVLATPALGQTPPACKVLDPELQGAYQGGCANGLAEGMGTASGLAHYQGAFRAGRKHGKGVKIWIASGDRFEGIFVDDKREGRGAYLWGPGSLWAGERYMGDYADDQRHGQGIYEWPGGERYSGTWVHDQPAGPLTPAMRARERAYVNTVTSVSRPGLSVCQARVIGIGVRDTIRGTVLKVEDDMITVRIDDPGQYGHLLQGVPAAKGQVVNEMPYYWKPC